MSVTGSSHKPTTRRYTSEDKDQAVRMARTLRAELAPRHQISLMCDIEDYGFGLCIS